MKVGRYACLVWVVLMLLGRTAAAQNEEPVEDPGGDAAAEPAPDEGEETSPEEGEAEPGEGEAEPGEAEVEPGDETEPGEGEAEPGEGETVPEAPPETAPEPAPAPAPEPEPVPEPLPVPEAAPEPEPVETAEAAHGEEAEEEHEEESHHFESRAFWGDPERVQFGIPGEIALRLITQSDMELSAIPTDRDDPEENIYDDNYLGQNTYLLSWLRVRPELRFAGRFRLVGQVDLLHGHLAGDDTHDVGEARDDRSHQHAISAEGINPRHLYLEWNTGVGVLRLGQMGSYWGMGLMANDGDHADDYLFGDHRYGDIVERVVFFTKPFYNLTQSPIRELAMFVGGDIVFDDGIADLVEGDFAWQVVGGLLWRLDPHRALGLYIAYRNQTYDDGDTLEVTALDFYGEWNLRLAHEIYGYAETEIVGIFGNTNVAPNLEHQELDVTQFGAAVRVGVRLDDYGLDIRVEGGYTSGDANTNDGYINRFTADSDFRVGMILFPELLAWSTARASSIAGNEHLVGVGQDGIELLPTNGGIAGAAYIYPSITWAPLDWLDIRFAMVIAQATSDVISPFETKRRGEPSSFRGAPASNRDLGLELDLGVYARWNLRYVEIRGGLEGAWCRPGNAFNDEYGERHDDIGMFRGRLQLDW